MAEAQYTVARVRNYPSRDGKKRTTQKVVINMPNLTPEQVARELQKKTRYKNVPIEQIVKDIEIIGDERSLTPSDVVKLGSLSDKESRVAK